MRLDICFNYAFIHTFIKFILLFFGVCPINRLLLIGPYPYQGPILVGPTIVTHLIFRVSMGDCLSSGDSRARLLAHTTKKSSSSRLLMLVLSTMTLSIRSYALGLPRLT